MGVRVKVGFKYSVGVLHRLGGEGCYVGKGNEKNFRAPLAPPYVWLVAIEPLSRSGEKNPTFRRNVPASRFFSKRGSRCPGSRISVPGRKHTFLLVVR